MIVFDGLTTVIGSTLNGCSWNIAHAFALWIEYDHIKEKKLQGLY